jgi:hypothetical protein
VKAWITLKTIPTILGLVVRTPIWAVNYSINYKRAKREFKNQLIIQGVPKKDAEELAELFPFKISDFISTAQNFRQY